MRGDEDGIALDLLQRFRFLRSSGKFCISPLGSAMKAASGVTTNSRFHAEFAFRRADDREKRSTVSICMGKSPCGVFCVSVIFAFTDLIAASLVSPPIAATTFAAKALPSSFEAVGFSLSSSFAPGGGGMVISISFTGPSDERGLSNSFVLPTTSTAS